MSKGVMLKPWFFRGTTDEWDLLTREEQEVYVANYWASKRKHKTCPTCGGEGFVLDDKL